MKVVYLSLSYVPSRRASSVHVMKMCQAMAKRGIETTLVTKRSRKRQESRVDDDFDFYGVDSCFEIVKLPRPAVRGGGLLFQNATTRFLKKSEADIDLVYARDAGGATAAAGLGLPLIFELHAPPSRTDVSRLQKIVRHPGLVRLIVISRALRDRLHDDRLIPEDVEVLVAPDAADPVAIEPTSRESTGPPRYGYIGQLYRGKAMEILAPLAQSMPGAMFDVVGGSPADIESWRAEELSPNLLLHGFVPHGALASWYPRFAAVLLPSQAEVYGASGGSSIGDYMSPMKLFEYMAAGRPIVSSDLPVLREVLRHDENSLLVDPRDPLAWKAALELLWNQPDRAQELAARAHAEFIANYTWDIRAERTLAGI